MSIQHKSLMVCDRCGDTISLSVGEEEDQARKFCTNWHWSETKDGGHLCHICNRLFRFTKEKDWQIVPRFGATYHGNSDIFAIVISTQSGIEDNRYRWQLSLANGYKDSGHAKSLEFGIFLIEDRLK